MEVCNQKCIDFCKYQAGAGEYVKMAGDKLKEAKTASPEQATKLKNEATTYLERAKVLSDKAVTPWVWVRALLSIGVAAVMVSMDVLFIYY